uniref:VOC domain-containing protein n=1 Tax=Thermosporothrix sp. COM3 TaxID=2490863 RepID=A0A455SJT9_9CHLR|nr:hypothetical protein KTC_26210 [Thermosporothrix sp. COM3]
MQENLYFYRGQDMPRFLRFEGGHIGVHNMGEAVDWYCRHFGMHVLWSSEKEGQTLLAFGDKNAIPLVQVRGGTQINVWGEEIEGAREANVRLCLATLNLAATREKLQQAGIRVTEITTGPDRLPCFDLYDLEGIRLTVTASETQKESTSLFCGYGLPRFGVRNLQAAIEWYTNYFNMGVLKSSPDDGRALMGIDKGEFWIEELPADAFHGKTPLLARPYFFTEDIEEAHQFCREQGLAPSPLYGFTEGLRLFSFYDPDGNQLNIWSYPPEA